MTQKNLVIGLDIGGTNYRVAVVDIESGDILGDAVLGETYIDRRASDYGAHEGVQRFGNSIDQVIHQSGIDFKSIRGIGVGCTGPLDIEKGRVKNPYTLYPDAPLTDPLSERFQLPVLLENDCNVAAIGEHWRGAGMNTDNMLYITISTGIGASAIIDGQLRQGIGHNMGEVAHMTIDFDGEQCECGERGCWEWLASGPGIVRSAIKEAAERKNPELLELTGRQNLTAGIIFESAMRGNSVAQAVFEQEAEYLGVGIANLILTFAPQLVVLGGGVMNSWDLIEQKMKQTIYRRLVSVPDLRSVEIHRSILGDLAGVIGAARLAV